MASTSLTRVGPKSEAKREREKDEEKPKAQPRPERLVGIQADLDRYKSQFSRLIRAFYLSAVLRGSIHTNSFSSIGNTKLKEKDYTAQGFTGSVRCYRTLFCLICFVL
ncbi:hypothetical protein K435DRAFT_207076 [Dendrothele bispora CBS 962.96]|uniref:Uncharacterized protein n=1 Tax=Dendrothele bispora (strain CBS 962.96) TaxID=1314807 RepID=A0A4S8LSX8_DENBC|nr:hypothetical protein K435DRAFT_207076 [Dendrothele bispora CBS 962.96]